LQSIGNIFTLSRFGTKMKTLSLIVCLVSSSLVYGQAGIKGRLNPTGIDFGKHGFVAFSLLIF